MSMLLERITIDRILHDIFLSR